MMKKLLATAVLTAAIGAQVAAHAAPGHIQVGNPSSAVIGGATELGAGCDTGSDLNGLDGVWYARSAGPLSVALTDGATTQENLDVWFYDADCDLIDDNSMATDDVSETGTAPAGTAYVIVDLFTGADASFTIS